MKKFGKTVAVIGCVAILGGTVGALAGCNGEVLEGRYTYNTYATALGTNWNPHTWETNADDSVNSYITSPGITMQINSTVDKSYQWVYEMVAEDGLKDVTAQHQSDLTKYGSTLPEGVENVDDVTSGFVYEIKLNQEAKWQNGDKITADDWVWSMEAQLNSKMRNYRANLYFSGEGSIAGAKEFYDSETPIFDPVVPAYSGSETPDYSYDIVNNKVYINLSASNMTFAGYSFGDILGMGIIRDIPDDPDTEENEAVPGRTYYNDLSKEADAYGYIQVTNANKDKVLTVMNQYLGAFGYSIYNEDGSVNEEFFKELLFYNTQKFSEKVEFSSVGVYKVDEYTFRYVTKNQYNINDMRINLASPWLVHKKTYEDNYDTTGALLTTKYGTTLNTTMSYGPYKLQSVQEGKEMVFVQNENWYGWEKDDEDKLVSYTPYLVNGKNVQRYQTTRIVISVMDTATAKQNFEKGLLSDYSPTATELVEYNTSERLLAAPETYTMSFFFNSNKTALKKMDEESGNQNSVVLSSTKFRKAFSLAINRSEYVKSTAGWVPAYSLMNSLYHYDIFNDPTSSYRSSEDAMKAICSLYGVEYGSDKTYKTLKEAYESITGYNLTEAKNLMKEACDELVASGDYTAGQPIRIRIGWAAGALTSDDQAQVAQMNNFIKEAVEGSGFGTVTFEAVGSLADRYGDVAKGTFAIGYGAWGGAALYPFRNMQVYTNSDSYSINEAGCWDPKAETLTLNIPAYTSVGGVEIAAEEVTLTWRVWGDCMIEGGKYANAPNNIKLYITAQLEKNFLNFYYRIPLASTTTCSLASFQYDYFTTEYNIMYGYGGLELISYNYDDAEWKAFVRSEGGTLNYK